MAKNTTGSKKRPLFLNDIIKTFRAAETDQQLIGIEGEKIGVITNTGETASYSGERGFLAILGKMYEELGWKISKNQKNLILQLKRGSSLLDLESDGRIELAGAPHKSLHDLAREFRIHQNEIAEISDIFGISWLGMGYHPISKMVDIEDVSEERKQLMSDFFSKIKEEKKNKGFGLAWYKKTAGIHVNIDFASEEDFARKSKMLFRLVPLLVGMFANSPFSGGKNTGYASFRTHTILNTSIERFRTPQKLYESDFSYESWINHVLSLPILFLQKRKQWIHPNMTFQQYMESGFDGYRATMKDFDMHMKSVWMDVRMRNTVELRCVDSLPPALVPSVPALIKGILYYEPALAQIEKMTADWSYTEYQQLLRDVSQKGLQASFRGEKVLGIAKELLDIAEVGLKKESVIDINGNDGSMYLQPIKEYVFVRGQSPAEWVAQKWEGEWQKNFYPVFKWCGY